MPQASLEALRAEWERVCNELMADEWPLAKQRRLRAKRDKLESQIWATQDKWPKARIGAT